MNSLNNIEYFLDIFFQNKNSEAILWKGEKFTYSYLYANILKWIKKFQTFQEGSVFGLESDFTPETISILFALIETNMIIVPLNINQSEKNLKKAKISELDYLIKINIKDEVLISKESIFKIKNVFYEDLRLRKVPGLVLFTSGSSGEPKAAVHDLLKLLTKFQTKRKSLKTINFLLFDHWGGLNTLFYILSNGGILLALENRTPHYICELIEKYNVELLPTSPTFLNLLLLSRAYEKYNLNSLKIITYGSEPMPENLLKRINDIFPNIKLQQTYGLIELGVMRSSSLNNSSLWVKIGGEGFETRIVNGLLEIKADSAMLGYINAESPFTEDGFFKTGDLVETNGQYVKILGRKSEIINVGGEKVFPQEVENVILDHKLVEDVIVYGKDNSLTGKIVCAKIKCKSLDNKLILKKELKELCFKKLEPFKRPIKYDFSTEALSSERFKKKRLN